MIKFILIALFSTTVLAQEVTIGVSRTNFGLINKKDILTVLKCTTKSEKNSFQFKELPNLRGKKSIQTKSIDAFYPVHSSVIKDKMSLIPIYIDEILIISKKKINLEKTINLGSIRGEMQSIFNEHKNLSPKYFVSDITALFKGFEIGRVENIMLYRSQLPKDFDFKKYHVRTFSFENVGIQINNSFESKVNLRHLQLQSNFTSCISNHKFQLSDDRKKTILNAISSDLNKLRQSILKKSKRIEYKNINEKESLWINGDDSFINPILKNEQSKALTAAVTKYSYINELFVFNHQGAIIASTIKTSDFDQSDEDKFKLSQTTGVITTKHINGIYFDVSTKSFQIGLTLPLRDKNGKHFGGAYLGIDINKFYSYYQLN